MRTASHAKLDLLDQAAVNAFFARQHIDQVYLTAAGSAPADLGQ